MRNSSVINCRFFNYTMVCCRVIRINVFSLYTRKMNLCLIITLNNYLCNIKPKAKQFASRHFDCRAWKFHQLFPTHEPRAFLVFRESIIFHLQAGSRLRTEKKAEKFAHDDVFRRKFSPRDDLFLQLPVLMKISWTFFSLDDCRYLSSN